MSPVYFAFLVLPVLPAQAQTSDEIKVFINEQLVNLDESPFVQDNRTLVPFRPLAEAMQVNVAYQSSTQTILAQGANNTVTLIVGEQGANVNGEKILLDVAPQIINGRTFIPLRFFSEVFGCQVQWISETRLIKITLPSQEMEVIGFYALGDMQTSSWTNLFTTSYPDTSKGNTENITGLALGWYSLDQEGNLLTDSKTGWQRPDDYAAVLEAAKEYQMTTEMVIHMIDGDSSLTNLLNSQLAMERAVANIVKEASLYRGVNLDFEGLGWQDKGEQLVKTRDSFTYFVELLSKQLKKEGLELTLSLHAPNSAYQGYDYKSLEVLPTELLLWPMIMVSNPNQMHGVPSSSRGNNKCPGQ
ncbi:hypothetical protein N752_22555 [Desulforamulus aquiferis]|nr:stalk domain-containing protein [Desulforamulus aquiferis]RYD02971.1 hypothetical protein N752_22555 [Desulforamulus aquiferis]